MEQAQSLDRLVETYRTATVQSCCVDLLEARPRTEELDRSQVGIVPSWVSQYLASRQEPLVTPIEMIHPGRMRVESVANRVVLSQWLVPASCPEHCLVGSAMTSFAQVRRMLIRG